MSLYLPLQRIATKETNIIDKDQAILRNRILMRRSIKKPIQQSIVNKQKKTFVYSDEVDSMYDEDAMENVSEKVKKGVLRTAQHLSVHDGKLSGVQELLDWKKQFHFASFPLFDFGNWIPFVMARWPCLGTGCGLPQVAFKNSKGIVTSKHMHFCVRLRDVVQT